MVSQRRGLMPGCHLGGYHQAFIQREISGAFPKQCLITALGCMGRGIPLLARRRQGGVRGDTGQIIE
jgi:hypothetical protein